MNLTDDQIIAKAIAILEARATKGIALTSPASAANLVRLKMASLEREVFAALFLDNSHCLIEYRELFFGTIDGAAVYPREVVKAALQANAAAVIFAHNHPSGNTEPSQADRKITSRLVDALALVDVRVLDHFVVSDAGFTSFAERGLI